MSGRPGPPASLPGRARRPPQGHWLRTLGRLGLGPLPTLPQSARNIYFGFWNIHSIPASNPDAEARWGHRGHEAHRGARLRAGGCVKAWRDGTCRRLGGRSCRDGGQGARSTCVMPAPGGAVYEGKLHVGGPPPRVTAERPPCKGGTAAGKQVVGSRSPAALGSTLHQARRTDSYGPLRPGLASSSPPSSSPPSGSPPSEAAPLTLRKVKFPLPSSERGSAI